MNGGEARAFDANQMAAYLEFVNEISKTAIIVGNVMVPSIPAGHRVMLATLKIDERDLFPTQWFPDDRAQEYAAKAIWGWSATVLDQIARAAGVRWDVDRCRRLDDGSDDNRFEYRVEGEWMDLGGRKVALVGTYEIDFFEYRAEERQKKLDQWDKAVNHENPSWRRPPKDALPGESREVYADRKADAAERALRKMKLRRGETGARNRAIAKAFGLRRGGWVKTEVLAKVLLVARLEPIIDFDRNPELARALALDTLGILGTLAKTGQGDTLRALIMGTPDTPRRTTTALPAAPQPQVVQLPPPERLEDVDDADDTIDHDVAEAEGDGAVAPEDVVVEHGTQTVADKQQPIAQPVVREKEPVAQPEPAQGSLLQPEPAAKRAPARKPDSPAAKPAATSSQTPPDVDTFRAIPLHEKKAWVCDMIDRKKPYPADRIAKSDVESLTSTVLDDLYGALILRADRK
jgi:hypothetical protein